MSKMETEPKSKETDRPPIAMNGRGLVLNSLDDAWRFAQYVVKAGMAGSMTGPEQVLIAMQCGAEIGLSAMQSIQNIYVVRGRPTVFGDALPGLVLPTGLLEKFDEWFEDCTLCQQCEAAIKADGICRYCKGRGYTRVLRVPDKPTDDFRACCYTLRRNGVSRETTFSVADAKRAGLWEKRTEKGSPTPWVTHPGRMLTWRARTWNFRDQFADVLKGLSVKEEIDELPNDTIELSPEQMQQNRWSILDQRLNQIGAATVEDRDVVVAWATIQDSNGLPKYRTLKEAVDNEFGVRDVLNGLALEQRKGVAWSDMLKEAKQQMVGEQK